MVRRRVDNSPQSAFDLGLEAPAPVQRYEYVEKREPDRVDNSAKVVPQLSERAELPVEEPPRFRNSDPETSRGAADLMKDRIQPIQQKIIDALSVRPDGMTTREIEAATGIEFATITPRMRPLATKGLIRVALDENGKQVKRTFRGSPESLVWVLA